MNKKEKLAFLLGMLSGDGCLPIKHSGQGYRDYAVQFYNCKREIVELFDKIFFDLFHIHGNIYYRDRENRKRLFEYCKYSKVIVEKLKKLGFPEGVKRDILRVLEPIKLGTKGEKAIFVLGVLITDGSLRKKGDILFHSGSKLFLEDLSELLESLINRLKPVKNYIQNEKYLSYQLYLSKEEALGLISNVSKRDWGLVYSTLRPN